ncbi:MAG: hypothetical protein AB7O26_02690 [Planctomycetaceae bacterium]
MKFAEVVFNVAGVYGLLSLPPMYFLESRISIDNPPAITHPEFFYGFLGVALAWQAMFFVIGNDPARYRPAMIPAVLEKLSFGGAVLILYALGRVSLSTVFFGLVDSVFCVLFIAAYIASRGKPSVGHDGSAKDR